MCEFVNKFYTKVQSNSEMSNNEFEFVIYIKQIIYVDQL